MQISASNINILSANQIILSKLFISVCALVDDSDLAAKLNWVYDEESKMPLFTPMRIDRQLHEYVYDLPNVELFGFLAEDEQTLQRAFDRRDSKISLMLIRKEAARLREERSQNGQSTTITVADVIQGILIQAEKAWRNLSSEIQDGSVKLETIDDLFRERQSRIGPELCCIFPQNDVRIKSREKQIKHFFILAQYENSARVAIQARDVLKLKGDFTLVETIANAVSLLFGLS